MKDEQLKSILTDMAAGRINKYQAFDLIMTLSEPVTEKSISLPTDEDSETMFENRYGDEWENKHARAEAKFWYRRGVKDMRWMRGEAKAIDLEAEIKKAINGYYNLLMDEFNGNASEEAIDMFLEQRK